MEEDKTLSVRALREHLRGQLPEYMLPGQFVAVEGFPRTPNGKLDRRNLPAPAGHRPSFEIDYVAPRMTSEQVLAKLWASVLKVERVGIHDNFFDLGGNSLLLVQLQRRLRDVFKQEVPLVDLFRNTTVASQAEHVSGPETTRTSLESARGRGAWQRDVLANRASRTNDG